MSTKARRTLILLAALPLLLLAAAFVAFEVFHVGGIDLPLAEAIPDNRRDALDQGWPDGWGLNQARWFHHTSQGTKILPLAWFLALERPDLSPFRPRARFVDGDYLARFGFLPSPKNDRLNPHALPIGFAIERAFQEPGPSAKKPYAAVGLTCAACHTGEIHYRDAEGSLRAARVDGAPAMTNLALFQKAIGLGLFYTDLFEPRFNRFADRVLGPDRDDAEQRRLLRAELKAFLKNNLTSLQYAEKKGLNKLELGFARTDALGLIGNRVFGPLTNENLNVADAPVNFPHLWDTAWFDWVQYNASIRMPMVRNIGEALGVGALINLDVPPDARYPSTVNVQNLRLMEDQLGGDRPFAGLRPPRWSDTRLPTPDPVRVANGKTLYKARCQSCHLPPLDQLQSQLAAGDLTHWRKEGHGPDGKPAYVLKLRTSDLQVIGTDPNQALNFYRRLALVGGDTVSASKGLYNVTGFVRKTVYGQLKLTREQINQFDRFRPFSDPAFEAGQFDLHDEGKIAETIVARLAYKARPLDGIWATAPYFHNGSVPSLYQVLLPAAERDASFYLGSKRLDPVDVGFEKTKFDGAFKLDTTLSGNRNTGHEFRDLTLDEIETVRKIPPPPRVNTPDDARWSRALDIALPDWQALTAPQKAARVHATTLQLLDSSPYVLKGLIGPALTETERRDLVEYLKTL